MKVFLVLLLAFTVSGCRCEKQLPVAETTFMAWLEPGAPAPSEAELKAFKSSLTRLNFRQLSQVLEHLNQEHLKELVPERTQFWATRKDPPPTWQEAAYAVVDELLEEDLSPYTTAEILGFDSQESLKNQIFLTRLGLKHPRKGGFILAQYYKKFIDYNNDNFPGQAARPFYSAIYTNDPTHAQTLLTRPIKIADYSAQSLRSDGFQACLFSATTPREIEELLALTISHKFQNRYGGFHGIIDTIYYTDSNILTHLTHGVALLAQMEPGFARSWILKNKKKIGDHWAFGYMSGAVGFPIPVPDDFQSKYESAIEFIARHTSPESDTVERVMTPYGPPSPKLNQLIKEIRDQQEANPAQPN